MVWKRRAVTPRVSQYPPELQYKSRPQAREQLYPDLPVADIQHHINSNFLCAVGVHAGDKPWDTTGLPSSNLGGCPWGRAPPEAAGTQTGVLTLPDPVSDHQILLSRARLGCGCEYMRSPGKPNSLPFPTRKASQTSSLAPIWAAPCQG